MRINSKSLIGAACMLLMGISCTQNVTESQKPLTDKELRILKIDSLNSIINTLAKKGELDIKTTMYTVEAYEDFNHYYPEDEKSGLFLMKAGELYENVLNDKQRAIRRYQSAYLHKTEFEAKPMALFRSANLYADIGDTTRAIETFNLFIQKFPTHDFADDAQNMIKITRMGMEEFIKQAQQNQNK